MLGVCLCVLSIAAIVTVTVASQRKGWGLAHNWVMWLFPASQMGLLVCWYLSIASSGAGVAVSVATFGLSLLCCVVNWFLFRGLKVAAEHAAQAERARILEERVVAQRTQLECVDAWRREADGIREDLRCRLQQVQSLVAADNDEEALRCLDGIAGVTKARQRRWCQNQAVDSLLAFKIAQLEEAGIAMACDVTVPENAGVPNTELCAVFSNLLDNASQASSNVPADKRFVDLKSKISGGMLVVTLRNACAPDQEPEESNAKLDKLLPKHGWGLGILEAIAARHEGVFEARKENSVFYTMVALSV